MYKGKGVRRYFLRPRDVSQGVLRFAPVSPSVCLSVCPSVRHTLRYNVCVINSHSFQWIFVKPCIPVVDILKMCMWVFDKLDIILTELQHIELCHFRQHFAL